MADDELSIGVGLETKQAVAVLEKIHDILVDTVIAEDDAIESTKKSERARQSWGVTSLKWIGIISGMMKKMWSMAKSSFGKLNQAILPELGLEQTANSFDISVQSLDKWRMALRTLNIQTKETDKSMGALAKISRDYQAWSVGGSESFIAMQGLDIDPRDMWNKDADEMFAIVMQKVDELNKKNGSTKQSMAFLERIGMSTNLAKKAGQIPSALDSVLPDVITQSQIDAALEMNEALERVKRTFTIFKRQIIEKLVPLVDFLSVKIHEIVNLPEEKKKKLISATKVIAQHHPLAILGKGLGNAAGFLVTEYRNMATAKKAYEIESRRYVEKQRLKKKEDAAIASEKRLRHLNSMGGFGYDPDYDARPIIVKPVINISGADVPPLDVDVEYSYSQVTSDRK